MTLLALFRLHLSIPVAKPLELGRTDQIRRINVGAFDREPQQRPLLDMAHLLPLGLRLTMHAEWSNCELQSSASRLSLVS